MSHFAVVVLLPRLQAAEINAEIDRLLEPYSENLDVPEYPKACYCVSHDAKMHGRKMAEKLVGSWNEQRDLFNATQAGKALQARLRAAHEASDWDLHDTVAEEAQKQFRAFKAEFDQSWETTKRDYTENHPQYGKADPECEDCDGTGTYLSSYNPDSKWDWYRVGGRFDGLMTNNPQESEGGFNFASKHETLANNSVPVQELIDSAEPFIPYALVTPEGEWIERGEMGWWGMSSGDKDKAVWDAQVIAIYQKFSSLDAVLLDCHI